MFFFALASSSTLKVCPKGFFDVMNKCYRFTTNPNTWSKAREECLSHHADLASFDTKDRIEGVTTHVRLHVEDAGHFWIGLQREVSGNFEWSDGSQLNVQNWAQGEPNQLFLEHCVVSYPDGSWNDEVCRLWHLGLCQREPLTMRVDVPKQDTALHGQTLQAKGATASAEDTKTVADRPETIILSFTPPEQEQFSRNNRFKNLMKVMFTLALMLAVCRCVVAVVELGTLD